MKPKTKVLVICSLLALTMLLVACPKGKHKPDNSAIPPPQTFVGYGIVNKWHTIDPEKLANDLAARGLNITHIEYAAMNDGPINASFDFHHDAYKKFITAMRAKGIWTFVNVINWNRVDMCSEALNDAWYMNELNFIKSMGTSRIILQPVSEWVGGRNHACWPKAKRWHDLTKANWAGLTSWNRTSRPKSPEGWGHYFEYHPCNINDLGPKFAIMTTDCGGPIQYYQGGNDEGMVVRKAELERYVRNVLRSGHHFIYYGFRQRTIDTGAMDAIARGKQ